MIEKSKLSARFIKKDTEKQIEEKIVPSKLKLKKKILAQEPVVEQKTIEQKADISSEIKKELFEKIYSVPVWFDYTSAEQKDLIKSFLSKRALDCDKDELVEKLYSEICGFGALNHLISQENVTAVFVNGTKSVHIEISGRVLNTEIKLSNKELQFILNSILYKTQSDSEILNLKVNNLYVTVINSAISPDGVNIIIRKNIDYDYQKFIDSGIITKELFGFIVSALRSKKNIVISGDINSGKTVFLDVLLNSSLKYNRTLLLEENSQINFESDLFTRFKINKKSETYLNLLAEVMKMAPEFIITDFNEPVSEISEYSGTITTLRAVSVESAILKLTSEFVKSENLPEKNAKIKVLRNYDYIVQINKNKDGLSRGTAIAELTPARTAAQSVKYVAKLKGDEYITELPQFYAEELSPRFLKQK